MDDVPLSKYTFPLHVIDHTIVTLLHPAERMRPHYYVYVQFGLFLIKIWLVQESEQILLVLKETEKRYVSFLVFSSR